jgi:hypothetical protein
MSVSPNRAPRWLSRAALGAIIAILVALGAIPCTGQQIHRNNFESNRTSWIKGPSDVAFDETDHKTVEQVAHDGQRSEHIQITTKQQGTYVYYYYPTARAPINDELTASIWVKSNRQGIQLSARVVLPREADPSNLDDRLTTVLKGDVYRQTNGWQRLEIPRISKKAKQVQNEMQGALRRQVNFQDAFIDRLVINVLGGPGDTEVWIDELEIGPVVDSPAAKAAATTPGKNAPPIPPASSGKAIEFNGSNLMIDGKRFFMKAIRHTDTPPDVLRAAGFNTVFLDSGWDPAVLKQMVDQGFFLVPTLPVTSEDARFVSTEGLTKEIRGFPESESLLFWNLGTSLAYEQTAIVKNAAQQIMNADRHHVVGADVWDGTAAYSSTLNLVSVHRWPLMSMMELTQYRDWLMMRTQLANPGAYMWTWVQTHMPEEYSQMVYKQSAAQAYSEPVGPQPEQVRLLTYLAVGCGFRGVGYWSDRFLANSHQGRDRLLTVALLNQELEFLEPMLSTTNGMPQWLDTSDPSVKAAVLRTKKGILLLPMYLGGGAQFVPGQSAVSKLTIDVPQVPPSFQCWEVTPGDVREISQETSVGGVKIAIKDFGVTTAIVFTPDMALVKYFQELCYTRRENAARFTYDLAVEELAKVSKIQEQLEAIGQTMTDPAMLKKLGHDLKPGQNLLKLHDGAALMKDAYKRLADAKALFENHCFGEAYREAQRALRPARILMRAEWDLAQRGLESPVSSPYLGSYYTLPKHWEFMREVLALKPGKNVLPGGDFETVPGRTTEPWSQQQFTLDEVEMSYGVAASLPLPPPMKDGKIITPKASWTDPKPTKGPSTLLPKEGKQFVVLQIKPKPTEDLSTYPRALERTLLALTATPTAKLQPGSIVQITGWVAIPMGIRSSADGALVMDTSGGDTLALRLLGPTEKAEKGANVVDWRHFTLYRRVPDSGTITVTLALTGIGRAAFDDIRIMPLTQEGEKEQK